jgi:segregation and condensation protein A
MAGKTRSWWQKIPQIVTGALRGLRAGLAALLQPGKQELKAAPVKATTLLEENRTLTEAFPHPDPNPEPAPERAVVRSSETAAEANAAAPQSAPGPTATPEPEPAAEPPAPPADVIAEGAPGTESSEPPSPADVLAEAALGPASDADAEIESEAEHERPVAGSEPAPELPPQAIESAEAVHGAGHEPETPEIEQAEAAFAPEPIEWPAEETSAAEESAAGRNEPVPPAIEETVLRAEVETAAIAAEPELDYALESAMAEETQPAAPEPAAHPADAESAQLEAAEGEAPPEPGAEQEFAAVPELAAEPEAAEPAGISAAPPPAQAAAAPPPAPPREPIKKEDGPDTLPISVFVNEVYEGPFDLLLDLIRKQDIDIYDIPIAKITAQFLTYVNRLKASDMDVAGEFIYTASLLIHIKSKMLLPRTSSSFNDEQEDPRRELVERLLEHERFKNAAQMLQQKQMLEAATWTNPGLRDFKHDEGAEPEIAADTTDLVRIFREILDRARNRPMLDVEEDTVTVGQMIQFLTRRLTMEDKPVALRRLLAHTKSERALIAMFLALLELVRLQAILLRQDRQFSEIFIKKNAGFEAVMNQDLARDDWQ